MQLAKPRRIAFRISLDTALPQLQAAKHMCSDSLEGLGYTDMQSGEAQASMRRHLCFDPWMQ